MVVVSHLFFFLWKKLVRGAAHMSRPSHYLELSISRQPLLLLLFFMYETFYNQVSIKITSKLIPSSNSFCILGKVRSI